MLPKLIVIEGTNASGKSALGIELAALFGGEIVSADSRQVYRRLDLGSGKITPEEMNGIPHHLLNVRSPGEFFSMADFQRLAYEAISEILSRGNLPFLVGGTGLYVDAVADGYELSEKAPDRELRARLETYTTPELYEMLRARLPETEIDPRNRHRVMRALERLEADDYRPAGKSPRYDLLKLGVTWPREILKKRIDERLDARLKAGMVEEVKALLDDGVPEEFLLKLGLEYKYLTWYLTGRMGYEQMVGELGSAIKKFAKRQMTWFRRDPRIHWLDMSKDPAAEAAGLIRSFLKDPN
jgi:tRNA isopentenyltransferase (miaA)